jgi:uncharacterized protein YcaQ
MEEDQRMDWWWGNNARAARIELDILFLAGETMVHHRVGTRRYFDLAERLLPDGLHGAPNPHTDEAAYQDWHVLRRVGSLGLAHPGAGTRWGGMFNMKVPVRAAALERLVARGDLLEAQVEGLDRQRFYLRPSDLPQLENVGKGRQPNRSAAILAPLDNVMWDRGMIRMLFDFDYVWEVYKPAPKRLYGYYVLPVLYGERFIGRFDPKFDRPSKVLTIDQWWWEADVDRDDPALRAALRTCFEAFMRYLGAEALTFGDAARKDRALLKMLS